MNDFSELCQDDLDEFYNRKALFLQVLTATGLTEINYKPHSPHKGPSDFFVKFK